MKKIFTILSVVAIGTFANAQIVINEVYGGGGSTTSLIKQDFVELINNSASAVTLTGAYIQYGGATSTTAIGAANIQALPASITLNPGQTFLVVEGGASAGTDISGLADATGTLSFGGTGGKIFLTSNNTPVAGPSDTNIIDHVSWGTGAVWSETSPAPATTTSTSISRNASGTDSNNNSVDFTSGAPSPKNSSGTTLGVTDINKSKNLLIANTMVDNTINFMAKKNASVKLYNAEGKLVKSATISSSNANVDVSSLAKGVYIVTAEINGETFSQKVIKK